MDISKMKEELTLEDYQYKVIRDIISDKRHKLLVPMDTGTGKTIVGLTLLKLLEAENKRTLVVTLPSLIDNAWLHDNNRFEPFGLRMVRLNKKLIEDRVFANAGIYITSYTMVCLYGKIFQEYKWDIILLDESHKIANRGTKTTVMLAGKGYRKGIECDRAYLFSGTLIPNKREQIYSQLRMVGYQAFWKHFQNEFFTQPIPTMHYILRFKTFMDKQYKDLITDYSVKSVMKKDTPLNKIGKQFEIVTIAPTKEQLMYQKQVIMDKVVSIKGDTFSIDYAATERLRLRQISRGHISNEGKTYPIKSNAYDVFKDIIDNAKEEPYIVWYCFNYEIEQLIKGLKIKHWVLRGGLSDKEKNKTISDFKATDHGVLFIQYAVGKNGLTFINCKRTIFFSLDDNNESFIQAQDRVHRLGQKSDTVFYYIFETGSMVDKVIYDSVMKKGNIEQDVKRWVREYAKSYTDKT